MLALDKGWYIGLGSGVSKLNPDLLTDVRGVKKTESESINLKIGFDYSQSSSFELIASKLGNARLSDNSDVDYSSFDFTGIFRFYDHQEAKRKAVLDLNLYGKLGLGYLNLQSDADIEVDSRVHMLAAIGMEIGLFYGISIRTELAYVDTDAQVANITLIKRFDFSANESPERENKLLVSSQPPSADSVADDGGEGVVENLSKIQAVDATTVGLEKEIDLLDDDSDEVVNRQDKCAKSTLGYPVRENGCALLNGAIRNIEFADESAILTDQTKGTLNLESSVDRP